MEFIPVVKEVSKTAVRFVVMTLALSCVNAPVAHAQPDPYGGISLFDVQGQGSMAAGTSSPGGGTSAGTGSEEPAASASSVDFQTLFRRMKAAINRFLRRTCLQHQAEESESEAAVESSSDVEVSSDGPAPAQNLEVSFRDLQRGLHDGINAQFGGDFKLVHSPTIGSNVYARYNSFGSIARVSDDKVRVVTNWTIKVWPIESNGSITDEIRMTTAGGTNVNLSHDVTLSFNGLPNWVTNMFRGQINDRLASDFGRINLRDFAQIPDGKTVSSVTVLEGSLRAELR